MERTPISSSTIASAGYDSALQVMEIEFTSGALYRYYEIPAEMFRELINADSAGRYFNDHVAKGGFRYEKIQEGAGEGAENTPGDGF